MGRGEVERDPELSPGGEGEIGEVVSDHDHSQHPKQCVSLEHTEYEDDFRTVPESPHQNKEDDLYEEEGEDLGHEGLDVDVLGVLEEV